MAAPFTAKRFLLSPPNPKFDNFFVCPTKCRPCPRIPKNGWSKLRPKGAPDLQADPRLRSRSWQDLQHAERGHSQASSRRGRRLIVASRRILVVDDEPQITRVLRTTLSSHGYEIRVANDGDTALEIMKDWSPDMVITDLAMPNMDGLELCRRLRTKTQIPILVLSVRGEERTKVKALDAGADDYVTKPFGIEELLARVRANLRRARPEESELAPIELGDFRIDPGARTVEVRKRAVHLTPKEFDLLVFLARRAGKVVTHRALLG